jgi:hypothetical protein
MAVSVTRLGAISPFGRYILALRAFLSEKTSPKSFGQYCFPKIAQNSPKLAQIWATTISTQNAI